jgi:iron complex transport system ATP-binding protein
MIQRSVLALSGGERQRVLIARALAQEADIVMLDEPTASLDIHHQTALLDTLRHLCVQEGRAVMCVLHDLNLAAAYADRVLVLKDGRIHAQGPPEEALTPDVIREVYGANVWVRSHPVTGRPYVLSMPQPFGASDGLQGQGLPLASLRIHVLCGGGAGAALMAWLVGQGALVSAGALNQADTDQEAATLLGIPHVVVAPFSAIGEAQARQAAELAAVADVIVLSEVPIGDGNVATLSAARDLAVQGKSVLVVQSADSAPAERDYTTGGMGATLWEDLLGLPSVRVVGDAAVAIAQWPK